MKKTLTLYLLLSLFSAANAQTEDFYFNVLSPFTAYASYDTSQFSSVADGWGWDGLLSSTITGELVYAPSGSTGNHELCDSTFEDFTGKLVLVNRGDCEFGLKVLNAESQGAAAVIIADINEDIIEMAAGQFGPATTIPVIMIKQSAALPLIDALENGVSIVAELSLSALPVSIITGSVVADIIDNCETDFDEPTLDSWRVQAEKNGNIKFAYTDSDGKYFMSVDTGAYEVSLIPPSNGLWTAACPGQSATFENYNETANIDLQASVLLECPVLTVDIETPLVRRCFNTNNYWIKYCNEGTSVAQDAFIIVTLDPLISIVDSPFPYAELGGSSYEFAIGDVGIGECKTFNIQYEVSCDAILGEAICATAEIFPDTLCIPPSSAWSGASIMVDGACTGEEVAFFISNIGFGEMVEPAEYRVMRNDELLETGTFQLGVDITETISFPADGNTYRVEAEQVLFYPEETSPSDAIEGCVAGGGEFEVGFLNMYPPADYGSNFDEECEVVIGAYDPNDKNATPKGYGDKHYIDQNIKLSYLIRFQNTGTDTAFNVLIRDTISTFLDLATLRPISSSHNFDFELDNDRTAVFSFPNIMLPDSNVNEPLSHGFILFEIEQMTDVPLETILTNSAAIYFDFNEPIITNEYFHTVGKNFLPTAVVTVLKAGLEVGVFPNPIVSRATFDLYGASFAEGQLNIYDVLGRQVGAQSFSQSSFEFYRNDLPAGNYFFKIILDQEPVATGQLILD